MMDEHRSYVEKKRLERVKAALETNNMEAFVVDTAADVEALVRTLTPVGSSVSNGGSVTLGQCGIHRLFREGDYTYLDRDAEGADRNAMQRAAFNADVYCTSVNAVTEDGELYAIDGNGNRVAAMAYGPARVVVIAGRNKVVPDIAAARSRNAAIAAPANCHRLGLKTPCAQSGLCQPEAGNVHICSIEIVLRCQLQKNRVKVILVNEDLGY